MPTRGLAIEADRVRRNTSDAVNQKIDADTLYHVRQYSTRSRPEIERRIKKLNEEWDIERVLETNASLLALAGVALGTTINRKWLALTGTVLGFLLLHSVQGWCPPVTLLRRAGVRTRSEIDREKMALKYVRGDFPGRSTPQIREVRRLGAPVEVG